MFPESEKGRGRISKSFRCTKVLSRPDVGGEYKLDTYG